ncbi:MAG TPA: methyltransferase domain-containing protein [Reyranella sp.]|nr:methyltransferase domain-containing protein [Reyranella sp.]
MSMPFDRDAYYESARAVGVFNAYHDGKEELFCRRFAKFLKGKSPILELGGGTGFHAALISRMIDGRYVHTDKSAAMSKAARLRGIESRQMDGLAIEGIEPQAILAVGISTMVSEDVELRKRQFREMARVLPNGGVLVITTPAYRRLSGEMHCLDASDRNALVDLGFTELAWFRCSIVPAGLWRRLPRQLCRMIEAAFAPFGFRRVLAVRKHR